MSIEKYLKMKKNIWRKRTQLLVYFQAYKINEHIKARFQQRLSELKIHSIAWSSKSCPDKEWRDMYLEVLDLGGSESYGVG